MQVCLDFNYREQQGQDFDVDVRSHEFSCERHLQLTFKLTWHSCRLYLLDEMKMAWQCKEGWPFWKLNATSQIEFLVKYIFLDFLVVVFAH